MLLFETVFNTISFVLILWIVLGIIISRWIIAYLLLMLVRGIAFLLKPLVKGTNQVANILMGNE